MKHIVFVAIIYWFSVYKKGFFCFVNRRTNLNKIQNPCLNLHTLSIMILNGADLISLFAIIPNIHCLHIYLRQSHVFELPLSSSIVLPHLVEFSFSAELGAFMTLDELMMILRIMPALQRLTLNIATDDARLLDGEQVQSVLSAVNILYLEKFNYAVEYWGASLEQSIIFNLPQKWLPKTIAFIFDEKYCNVCLYTIPFKFHRFWPQTLSLEAKKLSVEHKLTTCYGKGAYINHCYSHIPAQLSDLHAVMQKSPHVEKLTLWLPNKTERNALGKYVLKSILKICMKIEHLFRYQLYI